MARKVKSPLAGLSKAIQKHATDDTTYGQSMIDLPGGINNGIAKIVEAKVGTYSKGANEGQSFVYLAGTIVEPASVTAVRQIWRDGKIEALEPEVVDVEGQRTSILLPLCSTTNQAGKTTSVDEHVERMLNELRKLGVDTSEMVDMDDLTAMLEGVKEAQPFFKFSTSAGKPSAQYPTERIWENWYGCKGLEDYEPEESDAIEDDTEEEEEAEEEDTEEGEEAMEKEEADDEPPPEKEEADDEPPPEKEDVYLFKPPRARNAVECEVTAVFPGKETCNLKNLDDGKVYKAVPWGRLEGYGLGV